MRNYEIMYILRPELDEEKRKKEIQTLHEILSTDGGEIVDVNEWGLRDLAYEIKKVKKGYYVVTKLKTETVNGINEFKRLCLLNSNVLRFLITVID